MKPSDLNKHKLWKVSHETASQFSRAIKFDDKTLDERRSLSNGAEVQVDISLIWYLYTRIIK